jgi:L-lactate utilization protein LutC
MDTNTTNIKAALDEAIAVLNKATKTFEAMAAAARHAEEQTLKPSSTVARARAILDKLNADRAAKAEATSRTTFPFQVHPEAFVIRPEPNINSVDHAVTTARKAIADTGHIVFVERAGQPGKMIARDESSQLGADLALIYNALAAIDLNGGL